MDWIVFGDDWGAHPSTTQHLMLNVEPTDKVLWVNSIGMRAPALNIGDLSRAYEKALAIFKPGSAHKSRLYEGSLVNFSELQPAVLPFHLNRIAVDFNKKSLHKAISRMAASMGMQKSTILSATPVAAQYHSAIPHSHLAYLRLDVYEEYPGCDPELVRRLEKRMYEEADTIFATAKALLPPEKYSKKAHYLPQGVDLNNFSDVPTVPGRNKILGFFGTMSEWLDYPLIESVAQLLPDWSLEFVGKVDYLPPRIEQLPNVKILPPVPFANLAAVMANWSVAWIPFSINELTLAVNPLKIREYLAAGLPSISTPLPEVECMADHVEISVDANYVAEWVGNSLANDSELDRLKRRAAVKNDSWSSRINELKAIVGI